MAKHETPTVEEPKAKPEAAAPVDFVPHHEDPFLSFADCGLLVGRSRETIRNWVNDGILRAYKDPGGGQYRRVRKSDLVRFYGATALAENRPLGGEACIGDSEKVIDNG